MNQMPHQAHDNTVANSSPVHAENLPVTAAAAAAAAAAQAVVPQAVVQQGTVAEKPFIAPKPATAGKAPPPNAAAAIQMEQEATASKAHQSADQLLRKKRLGESGDDQNAESSVDTYQEQVVAAATTESAATPAEEAMAAGASSAAASDGAAWLPVIGGGLGLAAIGGGGGAAAAAVAAPTVSTFAVSIGAVAGPVIAGLNYKIYDAQGNVVASGITDTSGKITVNLASTYAGQALLIKITDANGAAPDFRSETADAAGGGTSLGGTSMRAAFVATGSAQSITVSPVTELAVEKMGITTDAATASASTITATNASVGATFGVSDILGAVTTVLSADYNEANGLNAAEIYGQLLAKFDGYDHTPGGSISATLAAFLAAINTVDPVARQTALNNLLTTGAATFEAGVNTGPVTLVNNPTLIITDSVGGTGVTNHAVTYTFTFSDAVTGFDAGDITVTNGTKGVFTAVSSTIYTLVVTPTASAQGADIGVTVNSGTGGIGHHSTMTATIAQNAGARPYDTIVPVAPGTPDLLAASDTGGSNTDNNTNNSTPTLTGTAEANSTVTLYDTDGTTVLGTGPATAGGTYSIVSNTLTGGPHTITAKATDAAGNVSAASSVLTIVVDTTNPAAAVINVVATDDIVNAGEQATIITGTNEAGATVALTLGGNTRAATVSGTTWSYTLAPADIAAMGEGANKTLSVTQTDAAGNTSTAATRDISVDTGVPVAATINAVATDDIVNAGEQTTAITGTNEAGATVALTLGGNTRAATVSGTTWSYTLTGADITAMGQGTNKTLSVTQTDAAGNTSTAGTHVISVDTQAPTVSTVALTSATLIQNNTLNAGDTVTATINFNEAVTVTGAPQLALDIGGTAVFASYAGGTGTTALTFSYTILAGQTDANGIAVALNSLALNSGTIKDAAGNVATLNHAAVADNANYMVDTIAPATPSAPDLAAASDSGSSSTDDNTRNTAPTFTGTAEAGSTVTFYDTDGTTVLGTGVATGGNYSITSSTLSGGAHTITAKATDAAGNVSTASSGLIITVDATPPAAPGVADLAAADDSGSSNTDNNTSSTTPTFTGTAEAGSTVTLYDTNGTTVLGTGVATGGNYSITSSVLSGGAHIITAKATDTAGNVSIASSGLTVTVDTSAPAMGTTSFNAAENGTAVATLTAADANALTWSTTLTGADAGLFSLTTGGVLTFNAAKNFEAPDDNGANRVYDLGVQVSDAAGNSTTQAITVNLTNVNEAPTSVGTVAAQTAVAGQAYSLGLSSYFSDVDAGDTRHYSATGLEPGFVIDLNTGILSGTASTNHAGSPVVVTMTDSGGLSTTQTFNFGVVTQPSLTSSIDDVTNFDVTSNIVLTASENVTAVAGKFIHIVNDGGTGYQGESTVHSFDIDVTDASKVTISGNKITINPDLKFDLDLANNYHILVDAGAFTGMVSGQGSTAVSSVTSMNFATVTPGSASTGGLAAAVTSVMMANGVDAVSTGAKWLDVVGVGDPTGSATAAGATYDLSTGSFVIVGGKDNDSAGGDGSAYDGITVLNTYWVALMGFGANDTIYIDDQFNDVAKVNDFSLSSYNAATSNPPTSVQFASTAGQAFLDVTVPGLNPTFTSLAEFQAATSNHAVISG